MTTTYSKEINIYNTEAIQDAIDDAGTTASNYITTVDQTGIMVHPANDSTSGWKISSALELFKSGVRYIKAWLAGTNSDIPTVRIGQDASGHADVTPSGLDVFTDASTSVAQFGADGARIGTVDSDHISLESGNISFVHDADVVFNVETNSSFTRTIELTPYLTNRPSLQHQNMSSVTDETYTDTKDFVIDQNIESGDVFTVYVEWNIQKASSSWAMDEGECSFTYGTSETKQVFSINETNIVCEGYVVYASPNTLTVRLHVTRQQPTSFILNMSVESVQYDHTFIGPFYRLGKSSANGPGLYAIDHGTDNYTGGTSSMASGENNIVGDYARNSFAVGESNTVHEKNSAVFGTYNSIGNVQYNESPYGNYFMFGDHLQQSGQIYPNLTIGRYNQITSNTELFAIGNGTSSARSNALTVDGNGNVLIAGNVQDMNRTQLYANASHTHSYLPLSGGTVTGNITTESSANTGFLARHDYLDAKQANNGLTETRWPTGVQLKDKNGLSIANFCTSTYTSGLVAASIYAYNYNTSGTQVGSGHINIQVDKSGNVTYDVTTPSAFRTAIGIGGYGRLVGMSSTLTLSTSYQKIPFTTFGGAGCSASSNGIKVTRAGTYMIWASAYMTTGYTDNDIIHFAIYKNSTAMYYHQERTTNASPYKTVQIGPTFFDLAANDVVYLYAYNQAAARGTIGNMNMTGLYLRQIA